MSAEWSDWIEHDGEGCPCVGMRVQYEAGNPFTGRVFVKDELVCATGKDGWRSEDWFRNFHVVIRYRIRKPRGLTMLQDIAARVREPVDA
jgi:hypothetical protein